MTNTSSIAQHQSDWFRFSDLERAGAVLEINHAILNLLEQNGIIVSPFNPEFRFIL